MYKCTLHQLNKHNIYYTTLRSIHGSSNDRRRVVVTGLGLVTPLGVGVQYVWNQLINHKSGIIDISNMLNTHQYKDITSHIAGMIPHGTYNENKYSVDEWVDKQYRSTASTFIQYAMCSATQALNDAKYTINTADESYRSGVCIGSGIGSIEQCYQSGAAVYQANDSTQQKYRLSAYQIPRLLVNLAAGHVSIQHKFRGPNHSTSTACTTGAHSIGDAYRLIRDSDADIMICGGTEASVTPISMALFSRCRALSTRHNSSPGTASRPFDNERDGFVMGEGSGMLVLEELNHAISRNANIYCEVGGYGYSGDAYHITAPSSDGIGAQLCMLAALRNSGLQPSDISYINAHATSTPLGDEIEAYAISKVFAAHINKLYVSSTKGAVGHMLGAAGSVESIFSILALKYGIIPPTLNLYNTNNTIKQLNHVALQSKKVDNINAVMTNSFGFGGTNCSLIFKKYYDQ